MKILFFKYYPIFTGLLLLVCTLQFYQKDRKSVIWSDAEGYYLYLPAVFIYDGFEKVPMISGQMTPYENTGKVYTKYTCGVAMLELPFFALAQGVAFLADKDTGGFSSLNNLAIRIAAIFYVVWGLFILNGYLSRRYKPVAVFLALQALLWGTNLFHYTIREPGMSHAYLFFLFAVFIWFTPKFLKNPSSGNSILLGLVLGLITLIRPTNCLVAVYLLLYGITSRQDLLARFRFFLTNYQKIWFAPVAMFLVFVPQFIYWHYMSGHFVIYSYNQEGFIYWNKPKIFMVLFDVQNGWLLYSPVAVIGLIGLGWGIVKRETAFVPIGLLIIIFTYIFASWWAWWFGGAFGHRCFVEFYAFLALPFAYLLHRIINMRSRILLGSIFILMLLCMFYNLRLTYLYVPPWDGPDWNWGRYQEVVKNAFYLN